MLFGQIIDAFNGDNWAALNIQISIMQGVGQPLGWKRGFKLANLGTFGKDDLDDKFFNQHLSNTWSSNRKKFVKSEVYCIK